MTDWVHAPRVTLIAIARFIHPTHIAWQTDTDNEPQQLIEFAGRLCYRSFHNPSGRTNAQYIENLLAQGHLSVLEHASASFLIEGISRSCSHEIVRHRHFSFSQVSQRYVDESRSRLVVPPGFDGDDELIEELVYVAEATRQSYMRLVTRLEARYAHLAPAERRKVVRQAARAVLPNATETALAMTGNFRAWRHFIRMRASAHADPEIRRVALTALRILQAEAPAVFGDFRIAQGSDGSEVAEPRYTWE